MHLWIFMSVCLMGNLVFSATHTSPSDGFEKAAKEVLQTYVDTMTERAVIAHKHFGGSDVSDSRREVVKERIGKGTGYEIDSPKDGSTTGKLRVGRNRPLGGRERKTWLDPQYEFEFTLQDGKWGVSKVFTFVGEPDIDLVRKRKQLTQEEIVREPRLQRIVR